MLQLLDHPFYQAWTMGKVSPQMLANYGATYQQLIDAIPGLRSKVLIDFDATQEWQRVVDEETEHIALWQRWRSTLMEANQTHDLQSTLDIFDRMDSSTLLWALYAFEVQQPDVAISKKDWLIKRYSQIGSALDYFDEHMKEEKHINFWLNLATSKADKSRFDLGIEQWATIRYHILDNFLEPHYLH